MTHLKQISIFQYLHKKKISSYAVLYLYTNPAPGKKGFLVTFFFFTIQIYVVTPIRNALRKQSYKGSQHMVYEGRPEIILK